MKESKTLENPKKQVSVPPKASVVSFPEEIFSGRPLTQFNRMESEPDPSMLRDRRRSQTRATDRRDRMLPSFRDNKQTFLLKKKDSTSPALSM